MGTKLEFKTYLNGLFRITSKHVPEIIRFIILEQERESTCSHFHATILHKCPPLFSQIYIPSHSLTLTYSSEHAELSLVLSLQFVDSVCHKPTLGTIVHTRLAPTPNVYLQTLVQNEHVRLVERFNIKSNL